MTTISPENRPPTAQTEHGGAGEGVGAEDVDWKSRGQSAYRASTSYVDTNLRKNWEDSIRAFNNEHAADSKYNQTVYEKRSKLYRPKTRSVIRKNEAAAAAAFFSSMDVVNVSPNNQNDKNEAAGAAVMKELLQYRLTKTIKWFHIVLGGLQDSQTSGAAVAHVYWEYKAKPEAKPLETKVSAPETGDTEYPDQTNLPKGAFTLGGGEEQTATPAVQIDMTAEVVEKPLVDKPCIELVPIENIRIDPGANWMDPIGSSPYVIHLMPMYAMDIKERMDDGDWFPYDDGVMKQATDFKTDSTRSARQNGREDPTAHDSKTVMDHEIVWVQRHIHRHKGEDIEFYMLGDQEMLTDPKPLTDTVLHGERPYVMGCSILESHRAYPSSVAMLGKNLQEATNEVANQRMDNVKFVLNKKWFVKRGKDADIAGLVRNVPGGVVLLDDPVGDVREVTTQDVTASSYEEQGRIDNDFNDLVGNFSAGQVMADHGIAGPARNMAILAQSSGTLVEYLLRTYVETFVQPVLRQVMLLEQHYETDQVMLSLAGNKAQAFQKFGVNQVTDKLLEQELTLSVSVGMGATDPNMKLQKFMAGMGAFIGFMEKKVPGINMQAVGAEIFGHLGYQDGSRFFTNDNPQVVQLQQQLQEAQQAIQQLQAKVNDKNTKHQIDLAKVEKTNQTKLQTTQIHEEAENQRNAVTHLRAIREQDQRNQHEMRKELMQTMSRNANPSFGVRR